MASERALRHDRGMTIQLLVTLSFISTIRAGRPTSTWLCPVVADYARDELAARETGMWL